jgi:hypothetical protein
LLNTISRCHPMISWKMSSAIMRVCGQASAAPVPRMPWTLPAFGAHEARRHDGRIGNGVLAWYY